MDYKTKYQKYKFKYTELKYNMTGGLPPTQYATEYANTSPNLTEYVFDIKIKFNNIVIEACPEKAYKVYNNERRDIYGEIINQPHVINVIFYLITYHNSNTNETIESRIPYYVSDGNTNGLSADLLLPLICFNKDNEDPEIDCSFDKRYRHGMILKIANIINLDTSIKDTEIFHKVLNDKVITSRISKRNIREFGIIIEKIRSNKEKGTDLFSILMRINNLLDFIICASSLKVLKIDDININEYIPPGYLYNLYTDSDFWNEEFRSEKLYKNKYREYVVRYFKSVLENFIKSGIIEIKPIKQEYIGLAMYYFNKLPNIRACHETTNEIIDDTINNFLNYSNISLKLYQNMYMLKLCIDDDIAIRDLVPYIQNIPEFKIFYHEFSKLFKTTFHFYNYKTWTNDITYNIDSDIKLGIKDYDFNDLKKSINKFFINSMS